MRLCRCEGGVVVRTLLVDGEKPGVDSGDEGKRNPSRLCFPNTLPGRQEGHPACKN